MIIIIEFIKERKRKNTIAKNLEEFLIPPKECLIPCTRAFSIIIIEFV